MSSKHCWPDRLKFHGQEQGIGITGLSDRGGESDASVAARKPARAAATEVGGKMAVGLCISKRGEWLDQRADGDRRVGDRPAFCENGSGTGIEQNIGD